MGSVPDWYVAVRASKYLGSVKPWEWDDAPIYWREAVLASEKAEITAQENRQKRESKKGAR